MAFLINLYNSMVIHAIIEDLLPEKEATSTTARLTMYATASYNIGGMIYSLNDVENGLLRRNMQSAVPMTSPPFGSRDPRRAHMVAKVDPRIHFALNCGAESCPPIAVYEAKYL